MENPTPYDPEADTIVAVSTAQGSGLRAIIRLSGTHAVEVVESLFIPCSDIDLSHGFRVFAGRLQLQVLSSHSEKLGVPALVYVMRAPFSYTCEDVVELHVPGSPALVDMLLEALMEAGKERVRAARAGEFTERAFLNGRIDLAQAEAVMAVITARNKSELLAANLRLGGAVSQLINTTQKELTELRAAIEAALDFDVQGIEIISVCDFLDKCAYLRAKLESEIAVDTEKVLSDDNIRLVFCGPPNAGKSSLLNYLTGVENAIVHNTAGTTRDPVKAEVDIAGIDFTLFDTAGIENLLYDESGGGSGKDIDSLAIKYSRNMLETAHLILLVFDASVPIPESWCSFSKFPFDKERVISVFNKADLPEKASEDVVKKYVKDIVRVSALTGEGIDMLKDTVSHLVTEGGIDLSAADCLLNLRQRNAVKSALASIKDAENAVEGGLGYEFAALHLREAADALGQVTEGISGQDILDSIFNTFCIGK